MAMSRWIFAFLLTLGMSAPAFAADPASLQVFTGASQAVRSYPYFTIFDSVHASVDAGVVTLTGKVTMGYKANEIERRVADVAGVRQVVNNLQVLPVSPNDDRLRVNIARAIYANPALSMYGLSRNPSIHVIVENGRVTLDGVVNVDQHRQLARLIAGAFDGFGPVVNNLRTDDEVKQALRQL
jgi:hyperosmotically inducible protein